MKHSKEVYDLEQMLIAFEHDYLLMADILYKAMLYISYLHLKDTDLTNVEKISIMRQMNKQAFEKIKAALLKGDFDAG